MTFDFVGNPRGASVALVRMAASALAMRALRGLTVMRATSSAAARGKASRAVDGGLVAVVYVSEGKDASMVDALESTAERACATQARAW